MRVRNNSGMAILADDSVSFREDNFEWISDDNDGILEYNVFVLERMMCFNSDGVPVQRVSHFTEKPWWENITQFWYMDKEMFWMNQLNGSLQTYISMVYIVIYAN